jgi:diguanylate cyclase (GGDEF)-like protein
MPFTDDLTAVWAALRQRSPIVLNVPVETRRLLLRRYLDMSRRNGRLSLLGFGLLAFGLAYEAPLAPRLIVWALLGAMFAVRARLAKRMLRDIEGPDPRSNGWYDLLLLIGSSCWGVAPCLLYGATFVATSLLAAAYVSALPAGIVLVSVSAVPLAVALLLQGTLVHGVLAVGTLACSVALLQRVSAGHGALLQALAAERENAALVRQLDELRRKLEHENAALGDSLRDASQAANQDPLTGLFNRRHLADYCTQLTELVQADREAVTVCVIDVDHFKRINDVHGHPVGDQVLRAVAQMLGTRLRDGDCLARYGGEEFVAVLRRCDVNRGRRVAEALRHNVASAEIDTDDGVVPVTVSVGVARWAAGEGLDDVIRRADRALFNAKNGGRDRVEVDAKDAMSLLLVPGEVTIPSKLH